MCECCEIDDLVVQCDVWMVCVFCIVEDVEWQVLDWEIVGGIVCGFDLVFVSWVECCVLVLGVVYCCFGLKCFLMFCQYLK